MSGQKEWCLDKLCTAKLQIYGQNDESSECIKSRLRIININFWIRKSFQDMMRFNPLKITHRSYAFGSSPPHSGDVIVFNGCLPCFRFFHTFFLTFFTPSFTPAFTPPPNSYWPKWSSSEYSVLNVMLTHQHVHCKALESGKCFNRKASLKWKTNC